MSDLSAAEVAFVLGCARILCGRNGLDLAFERIPVGLRLWAGHPYGWSVSLDVDVRTSHLAQTASGCPVVPADVAHQLRTRLRGLR